MILLTLYTPAYKPMLDQYLAASASAFDLRPILVPDDGLAHSHGTPRFNQLCHIKAAQIRNRVHDQAHSNPGDIFLYADPDIQFFSLTPEDILADMADADIASQWDGAEHCAGFLAIRCNPATALLTDHWQRLILANPHLNDQPALDAALRSLPSLKHRSLPRDRYWTHGPTCGLFPGDDAFLHTRVTRAIPPNIKMHHANWTVGITNKLRLLAHVQSTLRLRHSPPK